MAYTYDYAVAVFNNSCLKIFTGHYKRLVQSPETNTLETSWYISIPLIVHMICCSKNRRLCGRRFFFQVGYRWVFPISGILNRPNPGSRNDRVFLWKSATREGAGILTQTVDSGNCLETGQNKNNPVYKEWFKGGRLNRFRVQQV